MADAAFKDVGDQHAAIHCLCLIGLKAWISLDLKDREFWEMSAGKLKGVDCRDRGAQCVGLISDGLNELILASVSRLNLPNGSLQFHVEATRGDTPARVAAANPHLADAATKRIAAEFQKNPPRASELEAVIARNAGAAFRNGEFIFTLAPDLTHERAVAIFAEAYRAEQAEAGLEPQRGRWADWLPAVVEFERDARRPVRSKAGNFTRYRRIMDGIDFAPKQSRFMQFTVPD
jgi:hypothetical protein